MRLFQEKRVGVEESIQGRGEHMSEGMKCTSMEWAGNVPEGIGFAAGVARETTGALQAFRGEVKEFIFSRRQWDDKARV